MVTSADVAVPLGSVAFAGFHGALARWLLAGRARPEARCLVPVTSFSEYGAVRGADGKLPLHWFDIPSRPIFSFAGIWRPSIGGITFAFLTCEPNSVVAPIHPKAMPVILHDEDEQRWLDSAPAAELAAPYPAQLMRIDAVEEATS